MLRAQGESLVCDAPANALGTEDYARIRGAKQEILAYLAARGTKGASPQPRHTPAPIGTPLPLGLVQQRMWLLQQLEPESTAYNLPGAWRLHGALDTRAFTDAFGEIVRRHAVLRTRIVLPGGEPMQVVESAAAGRLEVVDLSGFEAAARTEEMMRRIRADRDAPFDLAQAPLFRARLFRMGEAEHVFFMVVHHVIWDGWSWDVLHDEMNALYPAFRDGGASPLSELPVQYPDFVAWHRELMNGPELERQLDYWRAQLAGELPVLALPTDRPRPERLGLEGDRRVLDVERSLLDRLWQIGREEDATLFMVLLTAYAAWLSRTTGQQELTIGVPTQDRLQHDVDRLIGVLVNTLVIRARPSADTTFRELLRQIRDLCIDAYDHQDVPLDRLAEELGVHRTTSHTPLYQTLFTFQDIRNRPRQLGDLALSQVHVDTGVAPTDLLFGCMVGNENAVAILDFNSALFSAERMTQLASSYAALLRDVADHADRPIANLSLDAGGKSRLDSGIGADLFTAGADARGVTKGARLAPADGGDAPVVPMKASPAGGTNGVIQAPSAEFVAPATDAERRLAELWSHLLGVPRVGASDNFFDLGGHSLLAIRMIGRLAEAVPEASATFRDLVEQPTLRAFASAAIRGEVTTAARRSTIAADVAPVPTHGQEAIWFLERTAGGRSTAYHLIDTIWLDGDVDVAALRSAIGRAVERHDALRQRFFESGGTLRVALRDPYDPLTLQDLTTPGAPSPREALESNARAPFDLDRDPLLRVTLLRTGEAQWLLQFIAHHIVLDGPSIGALVREVAEAYSTLVAGGVPAAAPAPSFSTAAAHMRAAVTDGAWDAQLEHWKRVLGTPVAPLALGRPRHAEAVASAGGTMMIELPAELVAAVNRLAAAESTTPFVVMLSTLQILLTRCAAQNEVSIGIPIRTLPDVPGAEDALGMFLNTVICRSDLSDQPTVAALIARNRTAVLEAWDNKDFPFSRIVELLQPNRASRNPLFQVILSFQHQAGGGPDFHGLRSRPQPVDRGGTQSELAFYVAWGTDSARLYVDFATDRFDHDDVARLVARLPVLLDSAVENPERRVYECRLLAGDERTRLVDEWNRTGRVVQRPSVLDWIGRHAASDKVALREGRGSAVTYRELWSRSAAIARALENAGVQRGDSVGVCMTRGTRTVVALLGVWRAGAAYVPLDATLPEQRLTFMVEDAACRVVLVDRETAGSCGRAPELDVHRAEEIAGSHDLAARPEQTDVAYRIYTSGSTGRPKGVEIEHGSLVNLIESMMHEPGITHDDVLLAVATISFDIAGVDMWLPLSVGATVVVANQDEVRDGAALGTLIDTCDVSVLQVTPATWRMLLDAGWSGRLRLAISGGEQFPHELVAPLCARVDEVWNMYGPTETTIYATAYRIDRERDGAVPIGRPIANTRAYVVDAHGQPVPEEVAGELWVGGTCVARGYHARPELTAERFQADPFHAGGRVYRTGDLACWHADGVIEHLGRMDDQVKVNGYRIELGEVEAVLSQHPDVRRAVVAVKPAADGAARLLAYVVWRSGESMLPSELRRFLAARLPEYMVPGVIQQLDEIPLTPNGKVDRRALPNPLAVSAKPEWAEPRSESERIVASVWAALLGVERVGLHDNFFELGGHSLLSIRAVSTIEERAGLRIDPRSMFFQTLEQVVAAAERKAEDGVTTVSV